MPNYDILSNQNLNDFLSREYRLNLSQPLYQLDKSGQSCLYLHGDKTQRVYWSQVGLYVLLYCYEKELRFDYSGVSQNEMVDVLYTQFAPYVGVLKNKTDDDDTLRDVLQQAVQRIIRTFRPGRGDQIRYECLNPLTMTIETKTYRYLKNAPYTDEQRYLLDEDGLSLIFSTREFYTQTNISTMELLAIMQGHAGDWEKAEDTFRTLKQKHHQLQEWMNQFQEDIRHNERAMEQYYDKNMEIQNDLRQEAEIFKKFLLPLLKQEVNSAIRDESILQERKKVRKSAEDIHDLFQDLLTQSIRLGTQVISSASQNFLFSLSGKQLASFSDMTLEQLKSGKLSLPSIEAMMLPFLFTPVKRVWSLSSIFVGPRSTTHTAPSETAFQKPRKSARQDKGIFDKPHVRMTYFHGFELLQQIAKRRNPVRLSEYLHELEQKSFRFSEYFLLFISLIQMDGRIQADLPVNNGTTLNCILKESAPEIKEISAVRLGDEVSFREHTFTDYKLTIEWR